MKYEFVSASRYISVCSNQTKRFDATRRIRRDRTKTIKGNVKPHQNHNLTVETIGYNIDQ